jgi:hypothetical protein
MAAAPPAAAGFLSSLADAITTIAMAKNASAFF